METHGKIKQKLLRLNLSAVLATLLIAGIVQYFVLKQITESKIKQDLHSITEITHNLVKTAVDSSVSNYLRALAEKNKSLLSYYYEQTKAGKLSETEAYSRAKKEFLDPEYGKVGITGYLAGVNSKGVIVIHPKSEGVDASKAPFMQKALQIQEGYLEYKWKNPGETVERDKAAYLTYFEPWDVKVWVSSYKEEFFSLVNMEALKSHMKKIIVGKKGFVFIISYDDKIIFHPEENNSNKPQDLIPTSLIEKIHSNSENLQGSIHYQSQDKSNEPYIAFYNKLPEMKWIIIATASESDLFSNVNTLRNIIILNMICITLVLTLALTWSSAHITKPLSNLMHIITRISKGEKHLEAKVETRDEIGELAMRFNHMNAIISENFEKIEEQNRKITEQNEFLEERVEERTKELQDTLSVVQGLKKQQDGDYYLTTLLTNPLFRDRNRSSAIKTEFLINQKKKFEFNKNKEELGGDLCITGNLNFSGHRYTVFFNGDAMGKSMQGAGGAIVMGSILNSIMARSAAGKRVLDINPEQWMHDTFNEVQRVFETFDGSMLVSCVLGLMNEDGYLLYFNAEHPFTILYRDGKSSFIEEEITVRKLGMPEQEQLVLTAIQLEKDDILIAGSDGRDDLKIFEDNGHYRINEDSKHFLKIVDESGADLPQIKRNLENAGEITDDLSLIKVCYLGKQ
jgi:HAMP domain-containing protein